MTTIPTPEQRARSFDAILSRAPVLPVLRIDRLDDAVPLARALVEAGLPVLEVTLRTDVALDAIRRIVAQVPQACVGAGTVLTAGDLAAVEAAGATFAISPGATDALYAAASTAGIALLPGIATASELMRGMQQGYRYFKFFPAQSSGGVAALRAFSGPFAQARFCPTGGIDQDNAATYLALPNVITVGGSWMLPAAAIAARHWRAIADLAARAAALQPRV